jgi:hypothetical protein
MGAKMGKTINLSDLTRHLPASYSVIEEIVEGFLMGHQRRRPSLQTEL